MSDEQNSAERYDLNRFVEAQRDVYETALGELRAGHKRTHWMWFIFPQLAGLGFSSTAQRYAIKSLEEARAYLAHPALGKRLRECAEAVGAVEGRSAAEIFGYPDDLKFKSSLTLFAEAEGDAIFKTLLAKYFDGAPDDKTLALLDQKK